jgi:hypothetical protein
VSSDAVQMLATMINNNLVMFHTAGIFGLNSMPIVWALVSRSLETYCKSRISGCLSVFVDDFMGLSPKAMAAIDQNVCSTSINMCFNNPKANSIDKMVLPTHCTEILGWNINLITSKIFPSTKAIRKLLYCFTFNDDKKGFNLHE